MAGTIPSQLNFGAFVPTTNIWDTSQVTNIELNEANLRELLVRLYQNINNIAMLLNLKDTGYYVLEEFLNSQTFFPDTTLTSTTAVSPTYRQVFRKVVNFGTLPNAGTTSVAHNIDITSGYSFTRIYGCATRNDKTRFIPLPFASPTLNENIKLEVTNTNVTITTAIDYSAYTTCYVICEYLKN